MEENFSFHSSGGFPLTSGTSRLYLCVCVSIIALTYEEFSLIVPLIFW
jgi:hypothetical protein